MAAENRVIRITDDTWERWAAAARERDISIAELIRVSVERDLAPPDDERARLRRTVGTMSRALLDARALIDDTLAEQIESESRPSRKRVRT